MDKKYSEYFGFLENEVEKSLKYYEYEYRINQVREWYDGYKFGENQIYNPWSIINFLSNNELKAYWINTSNNDLISYYLEKADKQMIEDLEKLFNKKKIYKVINDFINFSDLDNNYNDEIWQLFLYSGYITIDGKVENMLYPLTIPNKEIYQFFGNTFVRNFFKDQSGFIYLTQYLEQKNIDKFEEKLNEMLEKYMSYHDTGKYKEQFYHGLVMGIVSFLQDKYEFPSNCESGSGRTDLMLIPKNKNKTGFVLEFKVAENEDKLEIRAIEALHQIEHNKYDTELKTKDIKDIVNIGVAFYGKKAKVKYKNNKY